MPFSDQYKYCCDFEVLSHLIFSLRNNVLFASTSPIATLVPGGISDTNRLEVFRERFTILLNLVHSCFIPIVAIGFAFRMFRELIASKIKSIMFGK